MSAADLTNVQNEHKASIEISNMPLDINTTIHSRKLNEDSSGERLPDEN
jgi:hypothetical protein